MNSCRNGFLIALLSMVVTTLLLAPSITMAQVTGPTVVDAYIYKDGSIRGQSSPSWITSVIRNPNTNYPTGSWEIRINGTIKITRCTVSPHEMFAALEPWRTYMAAVDSMEEIDFPFNPIFVNSVWTDLRNLSQQAEAFEIICTARPR